MIDRREILAGAFALAAGPWIVPAKALAGLRTERALTISMLNRTMIRLTRAYLPQPIEFLGDSVEGVRVGAKSPAGWAFQQRNVSFVIQSEMLITDIDDFSERVLHPAAFALASNLSASGIDQTAGLFIPPNKFGVIAAARNNYDGLGMRGMMVKDDPTIIDPEWSVGRILIRFDVLFAGRDA
jgi:hypothetical protein